MLIPMNNTTANIGALRAILVIFTAILATSCTSCRPRYGQQPMYPNQSYDGGGGSCYRSPQQGYGYGMTDDAAGQYNLPGTRWTPATLSGGEIVDHRIRTYADGRKVDTVIRKREVASGAAFNAAAVASGAGAFPCTIAPGGQMPRGVNSPPIRNQQ